MAENWAQFRGLVWLPPPRHGTPPGLLDSTGIVRGLRMSGRQVKAGRVISIQARREQHEFERRISRALAEREAANFERRQGRRMVLAWVGLSLFAVVVGLSIFAAAQWLVR